MKFRRAASKPLACVLALGMTVALLESAAATRPSSGLAARDALPTDPLVQQGGKLTGAGVLPLGYFGRSVALSADGSTALIGGDDGAGAAWVFTRSGSTWTQQGELTPGGEVGEGEFGVSVALSADGNTALIGAREDNGSRGAAWVFTRSGSTWTQQGEKLTGSGELGTGLFGEGVALSSEGNTALIGGDGDNGDMGAAWVFTRSGSTWTQQGEKLTGSGEVGTPYFGTSVALSSDGDTAMVGAPYDRDTGAAWVFTRSGSTWTQQGAKLDASGEVGKGFFAESVALSADGNTALIGGPGDHAGTGAAWVFARAGSSWTQQGEKLTGSGERGEGSFGLSVALSSDGASALIGGPGDGDMGAAWSFTHSGSSWTQQGEKLTGSAERGEGFLDNTGDDFGQSVALSSEGGIALVGAKHDDKFAGAAWVFASQLRSPQNPVEYGRCIRVPRVKGGVFTGRYTNASCTRMREGGRYEWYPGVARTHFTSRVTHGGVTLETVKGSKVKCTAETGSGEYSGPALITVGGVVLRFSGCRGLGERCSTEGSAPGEIVTTSLEGELGITKPGATQMKDKVGLALFPAAKTGSVMEFSCGATPVSIRGSLIVSVPTNEMRSTYKLSYSASKGRQRQEGFVGGSRDILEASFGQEPFEQIGLKLQTTQTDEESIEVNPARDPRPAR